MKVLIFVFMLNIYSSIAGDFMALDEIETYLKKFVLNNLTQDEKATLQELYEVLRLPKYVPALFRNQHIDYLTPNEINSRNNLLCIACRSAVSALFEGVAKAQSDEELIESISTLCVAIGIMSYTVCSGAVALNLPIITYIIRNIPEASPHAFCGLVMQTPQADVCPHDDQRFEWTVELPEVPETVAAPQIDPKPLKVAILTDAHLDPLYEAFGVADCDEPTCCRIGQRPRDGSVTFNVDQSLYERVVVERNSKKILNLSMLPEIRERISFHPRIDNQPDASPAGYWGDYRNCDTPIWAYEDIINRIAETHPDIDMVYYIGDTIDHGIWETTFDLINEMNLHLIEYMRSAFGEHLPVIPTIGNHESQPTNQFAPNYIVGEHNTTWLYEALARKWDPYLTEEAKESLIQRGDFSLKARPGLKVISINTNAAYKYNWWLVFDPIDAKTHLDWLIQELYESELAGEKVHILAHIPPGVHDLTHTWTREYNRIVNRFSSTIAAEFNGHVHSDEFKLFYNSTDGSPINVAWGGGGATAYTEYNLNYKIVDFDSSSFEPESMQCYVYNMTEANLTPNRRPHWFQLYDLKNAFDLPDLSPVALNNLVYSMTSDSKYLDLYSAYFSRLSDARWPQCDQNCKINNLCNIVITVLWDRQKCEELISAFWP